MEIIKNYLKYSLWFVLIVFAVLLGLHWLPALTIDGHTMRRVDLLSDLRYPESETAAADSDSIPLPPVVKPAFVDTCRTGMTCIEDYSDSTLRGMTPFYKALDRVSSDDSDDKQVRIAVFGDSFIEADIFTADLREMLQMCIRDRISAMNILSLKCTNPSCLLIYAASPPKKEQRYWKTLYKNIVRTASQIRARVRFY